MDDTITIEECITRLDAIRHEIVPNSRDHFALSAGIAALYEMENAPAVNRWIPCSERLPEEGQNVLVVVREEQYCDEEADDLIEVVRYVISDTYRENRFVWTYPEEVTHWMPLPEPTESEVQNEAEAEP